MLAVFPEMRRGVRELRSSPTPEGWVLAGGGRADLGEQFGVAILTDSGASVLRWQDGTIRCGDWDLLSSPTWEG